MHRNYLGTLHRSPSAMDSERAAVKAFLMEELKQARLYHGRMELIAQCQLCGRPFTPDFAPALHELLLERDDVQGNSAAVQYKVLHDELNLMLICNEPCNIKLAKDSLLRHYLLHQQVRRYGVQRLRQWIWSLALKHDQLYDARVTDIGYTMPPFVTIEVYTAYYADLLYRVRERLNEYGQQAMF